MSPSKNETGRSLSWMLFLLVEWLSSLSEIKKKIYLGAVNYEI